MSNSDFSQLRALADTGTVLPPEDVAPFLEEWRGRWHGKTPLVLAPGSTEELSRLVAYAYAHDIPMVPQGGNTGLVGGQIPDGELLILAKRMRKVRSVDPDNFTMTVEAGRTLAEVQQDAAKAGRLFPLSIGSEGSCQIGGVLSTNAGGVNVLRYGNARDLVLGIEAVLPDGRIWNGLNSLRKNNTGYDLKHLWIGAEGTLGIITAATLKLFPRPVETAALFVAFPSVDAALSLLARAQEVSGGLVTSFELLAAPAYELVLSAFPDLMRPIKAKAAFYGLVEFSSGREGFLEPLATDLLATAHDKGTIVDGTLARNSAQAEGLWAIRHRMSEAMKRDPTFCIKCDVSVPLSEISAFLCEAGDAVQHHVPGARTIAFGHMGDGNIHYDVLGPAGAEDASWRLAAPAIVAAVHDCAVNHGGSISAEHGIGILKRDELAQRKDPVELDLMRSIKGAIDPKGLMNPGKLL